MKIDGIDIRKYNAKQLTVDIQPPKIAIETEWVDGAPSPIEFETFIKAGTLKLSILFRGNSRSQIIRNISEFLTLVTKGVVIQIDGYKGYYKGKLADDGISKTVTKTRYIVNLTFNGYMVDDEIKHAYKDVRAAQFDVLGTRDAPCVVEITPTVHLQEFTISGFDDDIVLSNLDPHETVIIDGEAGTVLQAGMNKFADVDLWEFPVLKHGRRYNIAFSSSTCEITIRYKPMWI